MDKNYGQVGRYYEVLFKAEALKRNLCVLSPECTHLPFDVAIFSRGVFLKIQVKGTAFVQKKRQSCGYGFDHFYRVNCYGSSTRKKYSEQGIDFMAVYVAPLNNWYIVPISMATGMTLEIRPGSTGKIAECKERWDLLG